MPPRSPLPRRHGLDAAWVRTPDRTQDPVPWPTMAAWLATRLPAAADVAAMVAAGRFVTADGQPVTGSEPYRPHTFVWFHRDLRPEPTVPGPITVLHRDDRLVVIDKPPFLSTIPRGRHVTQSVVVRLRDELGLPELSPVHRLDRLTSGVLMLTTQRRWRAAYQGLFEHRAVHKEYQALAGWRPELEFPLTVCSHLVKRRGHWQVAELPDAEPNAETRIELLDGPLGTRASPGVASVARYRLLPRTGRTHQLRKHLDSLGIPIVGDPLYPQVREVDVDDFSTPLQLLATGLAFTDPVDQTPREFRSAAQLPLVGLSGLWTAGPAPAPTNPT